MSKYMVFGIEEREGKYFAYFEIHNPCDPTEDGDHSECSIEEEHSLESPACDSEEEAQAFMEDAIAIGKVEMGVLDN